MLNRMNTIQAAPSFDTSKVSMPSLGYKMFLQAFVHSNRCPCFTSHQPHSKTWCRGLPFVRGVARSFGFKSRLFLFILERKRKGSDSNFQRECETNGIAPVLIASSVSAWWALTKHIHKCREPSPVAHSLGQACNLTWRQGQLSGLFCEQKQTQQPLSFKVHLVKEASFQWYTLIPCHDIPVRSNKNALL